MELPAISPLWTSLLPYGVAAASVILSLWLFLLTKTDMLRESRRWRQERTREQEDYRRLLQLLSELSPRLSKVSESMREKPPPGWETEEEELLFKLRRPAPSQVSGVAGLSGRASGSGPSSREASR